MCITLYKLNKKYILIGIVILFIFLYAFFYINNKKEPYTVPNIILVNPNFKGFKEYTNHIFHKYHAKDSHTKDGTGCVELVSHHWRKALTSPPFICEENVKYMLSAYVKVSKFPRGQNITIGIIPRSIVESTETYWNNSKENEWEEILVPFIAKKTGKCRFRIFTYTRAFNTDKKPKKVYSNGINLDQNATVYIDDIKIFKSDHVIHREKIHKKIGFKSSFIKVDNNGNFYIKKEDKKWHHFFPKMIYKNTKEQYKQYALHGFNGIMDIWTKDDLSYGLKQGIKYFAMATQPSDKLEGNLQKRIKEIIDYTYKIGKPYTLLMYMYDNENEHIQDTSYHEKLSYFINKNDNDAYTGYRARPIYYLNGQYGLSRSYRNKKVNVMDITGSYVGASYLPENIQLPRETLEIINKTHNQVVPATMIQLQSYLDDKFIPSLFFGIIQGGKGVSVWRDGGSEGPFQDKVWAKSIKDIFNKIDQILPLIQEPCSTSWDASIKTNPYINIGTREHNQNAYIILSNHAQTDQNITISLQDIQVKEVEDYFTKEHITNISNNQFNIQIGHGNDGYKILKLIK